MQHVTPCGLRVAHCLASNCTAAAGHALPSICVRLSNRPATCLLSACRLAPPPPRHPSCRPHLPSPTPSSPLPAARPPQLSTLLAHPLAPLCCRPASLTLSPHPSPRWPASRCSGEPCWRCKCAAPANRRQRALHYCTAGTSNACNLVQVWRQRNALQQRSPEPRPTDDLPAVPAGKCLICGCTFHDT